MIKYDSLNLSGSSTPPTEMMFVYAQKDMIPNNLQIEATLTYMQIKDERKINSGAESGLLRTSYSSVTMPTSFFLRIVEPQKDNMESKLQF
jgi:hypothetical protein